MRRTRESSSEQEKQIAGAAAAALVKSDTTVGLGTGTTVAAFLPALAERSLSITCVATSPATERLARSLGLDVQAFDHLERLDIAIDGADQVAPDGWLVKGGGGAQTREKIVAAAAARFVVIVSSDKLVEELSPPIPLELIAFGLTSTVRAIGALGDVRLRDAPPTPDGGVLADFYGPIGERAVLASQLRAIPGVIEHGLFSPALVSDLVIGSPTGALHRRVAGSQLSGKRRGPT